MSRAKSNRIVSCIQRGDTNAVLRALNAGVDANLVHHERNQSLPLLSYAAENGRAGIVDLLLERGASVGKLDRDWNHWTPLHYACYEGHFDVVKRLVAAGADINAIATIDHTPLWLAIGHDDGEIGSFLIDAGADVTLPPTLYYNDLEDQTEQHAKITRLVEKARARHAASLLNWLLAMIPLELPVYIYLELANLSLDFVSNDDDKTPNELSPTLKEVAKIQIIQSIMDSYRRIMSDKRAIVDRHHRRRRRALT